MQAFSSITMYNIDKEDQQETATWGGEKKEQGKNLKLYIVCIF